MSSVMEAEIGFVTLLLAAWQVNTDFRCFRSSRCSTSVFLTRLSDSTTDVLLMTLLSYHHCTFGKGRPPVEMHVMLMVAPSLYGPRM
uniref:Putative secreted peptide n=1 Tax=Anopheles braziliensis TaxID=58242 RepID=A0A2M3ZXN5_9DIPT